MENLHEEWFGMVNKHHFYSFLPLAPNILKNLWSWGVDSPSLSHSSSCPPKIRTDLTGCAAWRAHLFLGPFPQVPSRAFHQCHDRFEPSLVRLQESQESHWNSRSLGEARFLSSPSHLTWQSEPSAVLWYMVSHPSFEIQEFAVPRCTDASDLRNSSRTRSELWGRHGYQILDDLSFKSLYVAQDSFQGIWM